MNTRQIVYGSSYQNVEPDRIFITLAEYHADDPYAYVSILVIPFEYPWRWWTTHIPQWQLNKCVPVNYHALPEYVQQVILEWSLSE